MTSVPEPLRDAVALLGTALADQAGRLRSALAERGRRDDDKRVEADPATTPTPQPVPAPQPARPSVAQLEAMTPEEAARSVFFTLDPIPPVPPPVPREPRED